jgi:hypothetical protein
MSSDPLDVQGIDINYKKPTHQVIYQAVAYLLCSTPASVYKTLETTYFVLPFRQEEATEILFPYIQSGNVPNTLTKPKALDFMS